MAKDQLHDEIANIIKRAENAAYRRGWNDAIGHIVSAAKSAQDAASTRPHSALPKRSQRKVAYGSIGTVIESCLEAFGDRGISPVDVVDHGREVFGDDLLEASVRGRLNRMSKRGEIKSERGRWFRVRSAEETGEQEAAGADTSPMDYDDHLLRRRAHAAV